MIFYEKIVYMGFTDATGSIYCPQLMSMGIEAFETYLHGCKVDLAHFLEKEEFHLPIVHAEVSCFSPFRVGMRVRLELSVKELGKSSFTLQALFFDLKKREQLGAVSFVHVAVEKKTQNPFPLPEAILLYLREL